MLWGGGRTDRPTVSLSVAFQWRHAALQWFILVAFWWPYVHYGASFAMEVFAGVHFSPPQRFYLLSTRANGESLRPLANQKYALLLSPPQSPIDI